MNSFSDVLPCTFCTNERCKKSVSDLNLKVICSQTEHFVVHSGMGNAQLTTCIETIFYKFRQ